MTIAEERDDIHAAPVADRAQSSRTRLPRKPKPAGDPRVKALTRFAVSISALTFLGHLVLGFEQAPITPLLCVAVSYASALAFEAVDAWTWRRRVEWLGGPRTVAVFLLPAHISALACAMLLYAGNDLWPYMFAVIVANGSKYVFRVRQNGRLKHVLNPSNTGIAVTLLLFHWVGIAPPYQFTNNFHAPGRLGRAGRHPARRDDAQRQADPQDAAHHGLGRRLRPAGRGPVAVARRHARRRPPAAHGRRLHPVHELHDHRSRLDADHPARAAHLWRDRRDRLRRAGVERHRVRPLSRARHHLPAAWFRAAGGAFRAAAMGRVVARRSPRMRPPAAGVKAIERAAV